MILQVICKSTYVSSTPTVYLHTKLKPIEHTYINETWQCISAQNKGRKLVDHSIKIGTLS